MSRLFVCAEKRGNRTVIADSSFSSPIKIAKPFYYPDHTELMMMTASAGMLDGDHYDIEIIVKENASLKFTGQSFTKIFKSGEKGGAVQRVRITVENRGRLLYFPQPVIPFAHSVFDCRTDIFLDHGAVFALRDIFSCGRTAMNERFAFESFRSRTAVYIDGRLGFLDNIRLVPCEAELSGIGFFEGYSHSGMMYTYNAEPIDDLCSTNAHRGRVYRMPANSAQEISERFDPVSVFGG